MSVDVDVRASVRAAPAAFVALALDLERVRELHPRLLEARWLDAPVAVGARAAIAVELPTVLRPLEAVVGAPRGVLTLTDHEPGRAVHYRLHADHLTGIVVLEADHDASPGAVSVRGSLWATGPVGRAMLTAAAPLLQPAMSGVARRTIARADALLLD